MRTCSSAYVIIIPMILVFIFRGPKELNQQKQSKFMPQKTSAETTAILRTNTAFYILKANINAVVICSP